MNNTQNNDGRAVTAGVRYSDRAVEMFAAYDQIQFDGSDVKLTAWSAGAAYDLGMFRLSAAFGQTKDGWFAGKSYGPLSAGTFIRAAGLQVNSYLLGLTAPLGKGLLRASWQMADPTDGATSSTSGPFAGNGLNQQQIYSLGYTYDLSKRTNLYAYGSYARHALFQADLDSTLLSVGVRHRF